MKFWNYIALAWRYTLGHPIFRDALLAAIAMLPGLTGFPFQGWVSVVPISLLLIDAIRARRRLARYDSPPAVIPAGPVVDYKKPDGAGAKLPYFKG